MKKLIFNLSWLTLLIVGVGCSTNDIEDVAEVTTKKAFAYTNVNGPLNTRSITSSNLSPIIPGSSVTPNFDTHQAWFKLIESGSVKASENESWNLAFWTGSENRVILNYSVKTQAAHIDGVSDIDNALSTKQTEIDNAYTNKINGGTMGFGDFNTFDFHREGQFVIGDPGTTAKVYLLKVPEVEIHPDTTGTNPVKATDFLISVKTTSGSYSLSYVPIVKNSSGVWQMKGGLSIATIDPINKNTTHQYVFVTLGDTEEEIGGSIVTVQPPKSEWDLGLSSVLKKNYMLNGDAYAFNTKGFVLDNNQDVSIYRVQTTGSDAGAPGSYDPNFNYSSDPALDPANSIDSQFSAFNYASIVDSLFSNDTQEEIGQYWRNLNMGQYRIFVDRFYVVKLKNGDVYKLKFINLSTSNNVNSINGGIKYQYQQIAK